MALAKGSHIDHETEGSIQVKLSNLLLSGTILAGAAIIAAPVTVPSAQAGVCPTTAFTHTDATFGGCNLVITFNSDGSVSTQATQSATKNYDGSDDALIGVVNHSGHTISSVMITGNDIFGFDGDGIDFYTGVSNAAAGLSKPPAFSSGVDAYGGADAFYDNGSGGTVNLTNSRPV